MPADAPARDAAPLVALFLPDLPIGGVERVAANLAAGLLALGVDVDLVVADSSGPGRQFFDPRVRIVDLGSSRMLTSLAPLVRHLRTRHADAMISFKDHANLVAVTAIALARTHLKLGVTVHSPLGEAWHTPRRRTGRLVPKLAPRMYERASVVVCVSDGIARDLRARARSDRLSIEVIPNAVVNAEMLAAAQEDAPHPWFDDRDHPVLVTVGRLAPEKGLDTALRALALLRRNVSARLVIVGDGPDRRALEEQAASLELSEAVAFVGSRPSGVPYLTAADVVVSASRFEGMPTTLVEALAVGARVVATDCPTGPRELLSLVGHGHLVAVDAPEEMAAALELALREPKPAPSVEIQERFGATNVAERYLRALGLGVGSLA